VRMVEAGAAWLQNHVDYINSLNVYPVPDGDTGVNMYLTVQAALQEMKTVDEPTVGSLGKAVAHGALMGARGNSGVILSQIMRGMAKVLDGKKSFAAQDLAAALQEGAVTAYKGVIKPVEGTILTVAREAADAASEAAAEQEDIIYVLERVVLRARESVANTPLLLPVLADAGVVDAGGQGLLTFLEGTLRMLKGESVSEAVVLEGGALVGAQSSEEYGFEAMYVLTGQNLDVLGIRKSIASMGDSVLVVGDSQIVKVHVHTDRPGAAIEYGARLGTLSDITVENLQTQVQAFAARSPSEPVSAQESDRDVAIVAVVPGDGFQRVFESLGASATVSGGQSMNPSTEDLLEAVDSLAAQDVILLPNNPNIIMAAQQAQRLSSRNVAVVPTRTVPQGIGALLAFNYQIDLETNAAQMERAADDVETIEVTTAVRCATLDGMQVNEGDLIGLLNGTLVASGKTIETVVDAALRKMDLDDYEIITLYCGMDVPSSEGNALAQRIRANCPDQEVEVLDGGQPHYHYIISVE
jgi:DAK2 domain fusion protein YloV